MNAAVDTWRAAGRRVRTTHGEVFVIDRPSTSADTDCVPLVLLHGFPTSSFDFRHALPALAQTRRVVVHDHLGFGLSDKPHDYGYSLFQQADVALQVWQALGLSRVHLFAHDYGTSVATELLARCREGQLPISLASATLCNGSMVLSLANLRWPQKLLKSPLGPLAALLMSERTFRRQMLAITRRHTLIDDDELAAMWQLLLHNGGRRIMHQVSRYLDERIKHQGRWVDGLNTLKLPAHVLWGEGDPVAVPAIAQRVADTIPNAKLTWLKGLGHYPMLEDPEAFSRALLAFVRTTYGAAS